MLKKINELVSYLPGSDKSWEVNQTKKKYAKNNLFFKPHIHGDVVGFIRSIFVLFLTFGCPGLTLFCNHKIIVKWYLRLHLKRWWSSQPRQQWLSLFTYFNKWNPFRVRIENNFGREFCLLSLKNKISKLALPHRS